MNTRATRHGEPMRNEENDMTLSKHHEKRALELKRQREHNRLRNAIRNRAAELLFEGIYWTTRGERNTVTNFAQLASMLGTTEYGVRNHWAQYRDDASAQIALYAVKDDGELTNDTEREIKQHNKRINQQLNSTTPNRNATTPTRMTVILNHVHTSNNGITGTSSEQSYYDTEQDAITAITALTEQAAAKRGTDIIQLSPYAAGWGTRDNTTTVIVAYPVTAEA